MKIIQGKYKGLTIKGFTINGTRPTMDRVKESLFAMIQEEISQKNILDLFAGSGNLGIESLSMNAKEVVFVDHNKIAINTIKANLKTINETMPVINSDYLKALTNFYHQHKTFDIIFLDPPYNTCYIEKSIALIEKYQLLNEGGLIICESDNEKKIKYPSSLHVIKSKRYGQKIVVILKK